MNLLTHCALCGRELRVVRPSPWRGSKTLLCGCTERSASAERRARRSTKRAFVLGLSLSDKAREVGRG